MPINHEKFERKAYDVLEAYGITRPVVDVFKIARGEGIKIKEVDMPDRYKSVAGFYDRKNKTIFVQKSDHPKRKLFTIAHELGHYFIDHKNYSVLYRVPRKGDIDYPTEESEANSFAAHLLMPNHIVKDYMEKYNLDKSDYHVLSNIFGVPLSSMKHTLDYLK